MYLNLFLIIIGKNQFGNTIVGGNYLDFVICFSHLLLAFS